MSYLDWFTKDNTDALDSAILEDSMNTAGQSYGGNLYNGSTSILPATTGSGMDWLNTNSKGIGTLAGVGGLGLSAYETFLGNTAKTSKKNLKLLDQQIANNDYTMGKKKEFDTMMSNVKVPTGLASTMVS